MRCGSSYSKGKLTLDGQAKSVIQSTEDNIIGLLVHLLIGSELFCDFYCPFYTGVSHWFIGYMVSSSPGG
jgi:hypothetical protein